MKKLLLFLIFIFFVKTYSQTLYYPLPPNGDEEYYSLRKDVLVQRISEKRAWIKYLDDDKKIKTKNGKIITVKGGYLLNKTEFKCTPISERLNKTLMIVSYNGKKEPLASYEYPNADWEIIPPNTIINLVAKFVCDGQLNL